MTCKGATRVESYTRYFEVYDKEPNKFQTYTKKVLNFTLDIKKFFLTNTTYYLLYNQVQKTSLRRI